MDSVKRAISIKYTLRGYLGRIANLEGEYITAKMQEILEKKDSRSPFLKSRTIDKQIRKQISTALRAQAKYNREVAKSNAQLYLVEELIEKGSVFVRAKILITKVKEHSAKIKAGMESMASAEFYYNEDIKQNLESDSEVQKLIKQLKGQQQNNG